MATIDQFLRVNFQTFAWSSSVIEIYGQGVEGIRSIDYEQKREFEIAYAARPDGTPIAWAGGGKYSVPGFKIKMLKDTASYLKLALLAPAGAGSFGDAIFPVSIACIEPVVGSTPITTLASPCRVVGVRESREEGMATLLEEWDISCLRIIENGVPMFSVVRGLL